MLADVERLETTHHSEYELVNLSLELAQKAAGFEDMDLPHTVFSPPAERAQLELQPVEWPEPDVEAAAVQIQARIRGRQDRRRAAQKRLVTQRAANLSPKRGIVNELTRLDMDVEVWLTAQSEAVLVDIALGEFGCETLRDIVALIQDP